jgi:adenine-specific DNA-methyltransferase
LEYAGKTPAAEVLSALPPACRQLWQDESDNSSTNRLYYGNNLAALQNLVRDPEVCGKVALIYIDPPYATRSVFESRSQKAAYEDLLHGAAFVEFLRQRLILLREILSNSGSIYLHLDENMAFPMKVVLDEIFGPENFRNLITRKKCNPKNYTRKTYGNVSDYLLFYTKTGDYIWNRPLIAWNDERARKEYIYTEPGTGRRFKKVPVHAPGIRNSETGKPWRGVPPPPGKHWQFPPHTLNEMDARGEIHWSATGNPRRKIYLDQSDGIPVQDIWLEFKDAHNQNIEITGYPTEKNPALLEQIIQASSDEGDLVLDCFAGSGTTLAVASRLDRRWIGADHSPEAIATMLKRFASGSQRMGDFVMRPASDDSPQLFADEPAAISTPTSHSTIRDFTLFALEGAEPLPTEAVKWLPSSENSARIAETPPVRNWKDATPIKRRAANYAEKKRKHPAAKAKG